MQAAQTSKTSVFVSLASGETSRVQGNSEENPCL